MALQIASVDQAVQALKTWVDSPEGQESVSSVSTVLEKVAWSANFCRNRRKLAGFIKMAAGVTCVVGGVIVIVGGAIVSGGTALPAEIAAASALISGGAITLAVGAGVNTR